MNREQMVEKGARALQEFYEPDHPSYGGYVPDAHLGHCGDLIDADDCAWTKGPADILWHFLVDTAGPLTVVWTPEVVTS